MNQLRLIAGIYGGRLIKTPGTHATHPMGDRERGAIFNFLQHHLAGTQVLDAFAGSGAIGLEALSRGASHVTFLEKDPKALRTLKENIDKLGVAQQTSVTKNPAGLKSDFDIIIADPPYDKPQYALVVNLLDHLKLGGYFILSHPKTNPPPSPKHLALLSDKTYANANIKIYQKLA